MILFAISLEDGVRDCDSAFVRNLYIVIISSIFWSFGVKPESARLASVGVVLKTLEYEYGYSSLDIYLVSSCLMT